MNRIKKRAVTALIGVAVISLVITSVAASPKISSNTPLYAFRMEQASSEMSFLPKEKTTFVYTTERGYTLNYDTAEACNVKGSNNGGGFAQIDIVTEHATCFPHRCQHTYALFRTCQYTCKLNRVQDFPQMVLDTAGGTCFSHTCLDTCFSHTCLDTCVVRTCMGTCQDSCFGTCQVSCWGTCQYTCYESCVQYTCWNTCYYPTCYETCMQNTCWGTCNNTCWDNSNTCQHSCWGTCDQICW